MFAPRFDSLVTRLYWTTRFASSKSDMMYWTTPPYGIAIFRSGGHWRCSVVIDSTHIRAGRDQQSRQLQV